MPSAAGPLSYPSSVLTRTQTPLKYLCFTDHSHRSPLPGPDPIPPYLTTPKCRSTATHVKEMKSKTRGYATAAAATVWTAIQKCLSRVYVCRKVITRHQTIPDFLFSSIDKPIWEIFFISFNYPLLLHNIFPCPHLLIGGFRFQVFFIIFILFVCCLLSTSNDKNKNNGKSYCINFCGPIQFFSFSFFCYQSPSPINVHMPMKRVSI